MYPIIMQHIIVLIKWDPATFGNGEIDLQDLVELSTFQESIRIADVVHSL